MTPPTARPGETKRITARWWNNSSVKVGLIALLGFSSAAAQAPAWQARFPARVIGGRLVVRCDVSTPLRRIPLNLFFDYDRPCGLELHNKAADALGAEKGASRGMSLPISLHAQGHDIVVARREHGDEDVLDEFTRLYSRELAENACAGTIGARILRDYFVRFDLDAGFIYVEPARAESLEPPEPRDGTTVVALTLSGDQVWFPVKVGGALKSMSLATTRYDTVVDEDYCDEVDRPAGNVGSVMLKGIDLTKFVALRPVEFVQVQADGAFGSTGLNLLRHFRVEVDRVNRYLRLEQTVPAAFPADDFAFFEAMVAEEPAQLEATLEKYPRSRLAREGASLLLRLLVDSGVPADKCARAVEWVDRTRIEDLRCTEALASMKSLLEAQRPKVAILAGELGIKSGRKDRYAEAVSKLHAKLGEVLLDQGEATRAWEHLLSAAFGLPEDGMINLHLGRFYESQKRYKRAMSRYIQAVIKPESGPLAIAGLERVQRATAGEPLSVDVVDRMIAGKVYNFGAATKFKPDAETSTHRVVICELFTNVHLGRRTREGWRSFIVGGTMAQEGLLSHFPRNRLAVLTYHLDTPEPEATMNALGFHMAKLLGARVGVMKVNGSTTAPGAGRSRDAEAIYGRCKQAVRDALAEETPFRIHAEARVAGDRVTGRVELRGPEREGLRVQVILAERGVLYPGKGMVVVHRMLARAALTDPVDGVPWAPQGGVMGVPFDASLDSIRNANEAFLTEWEARNHKVATRLSTRIDPRQVSIVVALRDKSGTVLQAAQTDATLKDR